jgi:hypothetical protein
LQQAAMLALSRVSTTTLCAWTVLILMMSCAVTEQGPTGRDSLICYGINTWLMKLFDHRMFRVAW